MEAIEPDIKKKKRPKKKSRKRKTSSIPIKGVIDGSVLINENVTRQLPYILFLAFLAIVYIGNRYSAEQMVRRINTAKKDLKELRSESIATASVLMSKSKQTRVAGESKKRRLGLVESTEPPVKIILTEEEWEEYMGK